VTKGTMASTSLSRPNSSAQAEPPNKRRCLDPKQDYGSSTANGGIVTADDEVDGNNANKILPATLLSGFLGAGKTTLLKQILESKNNELKIAIIVNDMGALNIDANEIKKHKLIQEKQEMVEMHNGCICCTLRGDLLKTVKQLAEENKYDYLVIESTGISEPLPVAQTFAMDVNGEDQNNDGDDNNEESEDFEPLSKYARMDTLVTVLDTFNFASILGSIESEADREKFFGDTEEETDESDESIVQLLIDQIEFANVILLNKIDLLSSGSGGSSSDVESQIKSIRSLLQKLNPNATVIVPEQPKFEKFDVNNIINTGLFDMEKAQESAGWIAELEKPYHTPETEEYGIGSFVFRNNERPFHPGRLAKIFKNFGMSLLHEIKPDDKDKSDSSDNNDIFSRVVRCKGELWLSNADCCPIDVHSAGRQLEMTPAGNGKPWISKVVECHPKGDPESEDSNDEDCEAWAALDLTNEVLSELKASEQWSDRFGDRRSEVVFIGIKLDKKRIMTELENALLTDAEFNVAEKDRKKVWASDVVDTFFDGMPLWDLEDVLGEADQEACDITDAE